MILNPFTGPVYTKLIKIDNDFVSNIFENMLSIHKDSWSQLSLIFLKRLKEEEDQLNNKNFDINLMLKLLLQLNTIKNVNSTSGNSKYINKNTEYVIKNYLKKVNVIDNKSYYELKNILFQIEHRNYTNSNKENNNLLIRTSSDRNYKFLNEDNENIEIINSIIYSNKIIQKNDFNNKKTLEKINIINQLNLVRKNIEKANFKNIKKLNLKSTDNINVKNIISETINNSSRMLQKIMNKNLLVVDIIKKRSFEKSSFRITSSMMLKNTNKNQEGILLKELLINIQDYKETLIKEIEELHILKKQHHINQGIEKKYNLDKANKKQYIINQQIKEDKISAFEIAKGNEIINNKIEILDQFEIIKNMNIINDIYKKERKLINLSFKEDEIKKQIIEEKIDKANIIREKRNAKNIISETISNSSIMLQKVMDKNLLVIDIIKKRSFEELNFVISSSMILKNTNKNQEDILVRELLINMQNYKKTIIKEIEELDILKEQNNINQGIRKEYNSDKVIKSQYIINQQIKEEKISSFEMVKSNKIIHDKTDIFDQFEIIKNLNIVNDIYGKERKLINLSFKEDEIRKQINIENTNSKSIENVKFKNVISETINNSSIMLKKVIDKNLLVVDIIRKRTLEELSFGITSSMILKNINKNQEGILVKELLANIFNYKKTIIKEIDELHLLKKQYNINEEIEKKYSLNKEIKDQYVINQQIQEHKISSIKIEKSNEIFHKKTELLDQFKIIKKLNIENDIYNKERKLISISFKEDELRKQIIEEKINKTNIRHEIRNLKNDFTEEILLNENKQNNKKINTKTINFETIVNSSIMLQKLIDKNSLVKEIIRKRTVEELNFGIVSSMISKNGTKNEENILVREIISDIKNHKRNLIKEIEELNTLKKQNNINKEIREKYNISREIKENKSLSFSTGKTNRARILLNKLEIIQNLNVINDIYQKEKKLISVSFKEDDIKKQIIKEKIDKANIRNEIKKLKSSFIEEILLSETKLETASTNVNITKIRNKKSLIMNIDVYKNIMSHAGKLLINQKKMHIEGQEIKDGYDSVTTTMNYKKNIKNGTDFNAEQVQINETQISEQQINKIINETVENIMENKLSSIRQIEKNNDEQKINDLSRKVLAKIEKTLDYERRRRGL